MKFEVRMGSVVDEIVAYAQSVRATLIVMGAHPKNVLDRLIFGVNSQGVLHRSPCPVWLVPKKEGHSNPWVTVSQQEETKHRRSPSRLSRSATDRCNPWQEFLNQSLEFLRGKRFAVAGVSRASGQAANAIYRRLKDCGYEVFPINPNASEVEGVTAYPNLAFHPCDS